ncbi:MAG: TetR/AcrR family transcriptional regulator [Candidatus Limiplasma sp.]|nr:TetR/AcrR family transcriptional regulator [Candidatus Limiplasma sp.]
MANINDLRYIKTERLIEETYIELKKKTRSPVKVGELCKAALINKTTFYTHYETMEALHTQICEKKITAMLDGCPHIDEAFTDTAAFVHEMVKTIQKNAVVIHALFGEDITKQTNMLEACLLNRYLHGGESQEMKMKIVFAIGGAARLLIGDQSNERVQMTITLIGRVLGDDEIQ